jgi:hypothetical protein
MRFCEIFLLKRERFILELLNLIPENYNSDSFHDRRVEIKILKALFELLDSCVKGIGSKKSFHPFPEIFRQAGKVRDIQVEDGLYNVGENCW